MPEQTDIGAGPRACPLCQARAGEALPGLSRDGWSVVRCGPCGFVYLENPPGHDALSEEFAWEKGVDAETRRRETSAPALYRLDRLTRFRTSLLTRPESRKFVDWFGDGGAVLDVGCGGGGRVGPPFTPFGIEVSSALARQADARMRELGGRCEHGPGPEAIRRFDAGRFDGIVMRSYLEHEEEPLAVLEGAAHALKPDGAVYVKVPNYGSVNRMVTGRHWCGIRLPDHVNYFRPSTLRRMAAKAGFAMRILNRVNLAFDDNIHALLRRQPA